ENTRVFAHHFFATPPPLDFVFQGVLVGSVAAIVAPGSTGKGFFSLGVCLDLYTGKNVLGLGIGENPQYPKLTADQKIAFVTLEDQMNVVGTRLHSAMHEYGMTVRESIEMDEQVHFMSLQGELVMDLVNGRGEVNYSMANTMIEAYKGYRLIMLDTLSRSHTANENDNGQMATLISVFEYIAKHTGAAFVFIHHTNKGATLNGQGDQAGAARGAAAITDNIRCQLNLSKITEEEAQHINIPENLRHKFLWLHSSKVNYAESGNAHLLERGNGGVLRKGENPVDQRNYKDEY
ncbi:AAA family ATPase, partial [Vibrio sp. 10N.261.52.F3]|uniref:AAA family ATPase n=1 Tax=Vibrio sp. 10N.261.52.F3 TaxID=3229683 RepID=UPI0035535CFF